MNNGSTEQSNLILNINENINKLLKKLKIVIIFLRK